MPTMTSKEAKLQLMESINHLMEKLSVWKDEKNTRQIQQDLVLIQEKLAWFKSTEQFDSTLAVF